MSFKHTCVVILWSRVSQHIAHSSFQNFLLFFQAVFEDRLVTRILLYTKTLSKVSFILFIIKIKFSYFFWCKFSTLFLNTCYKKLLLILLIISIKQRVCEVCVDCHAAHWGHLRKRANKWKFQVSSWTIFFI